MATLTQRYSFKLGAGFISVASLGLIQALALRSLGPNLYGTFDFLNTFFIQVMTFVDLGTSDCFYTQISKRPREAALVAFYWTFVLAVCACVLVLTMAAVWSPAGAFLWPAISPRFVIMGAMLVTSPRLLGQI